MDDIKKNNLQAYIENQEEFIKRYGNFPPRIDDIDRAFSLYQGEKKPEDIRVLELGCCFGREYSHIQTITENYIGVDIQDQTIKIAQETYGTDKFICGNFEDIQLRGKQDIIFAFASLLHCDKYAMKIMLVKLWDVLTSDGILYISLKRADTYTILQEENGKRIFYLYSLEGYEVLYGDMFELLYEDKNTFNNQEWFTICLSKK